MSNSKRKLTFQLFDGAMGTMLLENGLEIGDVADEFNLTHPEIVANIHRQYLDAGAEKLTTNTFNLSRLRHEKADYAVADVITAGLDIANDAYKQYILDHTVNDKSDIKKQVVLDIGPTGSQLPLAVTETYDIFKEQVIAGVTAGADMILIETMMDINEVQTAVRAAKENSDLPVYCTMTFEEDGRTLSGTDIATFVSVVEKLGVDGLGANCSYGPERLQPVVDELLKYATVPILIQANAGLPQEKDGSLYYDMSPERYSQEIKQMAEKGVSMFGGCCGTTPRYIAAMKEALSVIG